MIPPTVHRAILLVLAASVFFASTAIAETRSTRERVVDRLLKAAGIDSLVRDQAAGVVQGLIQSGAAADPAALKRAERLAQKHFSEDVLRTSIERRFDKHLTVEHARTVLDWMKTPTARKALALERASDNPERSAQLIASTEGFDPRSMNAARRDLLTRFDRASETSEFAADLMTETAIAAFVGVVEATGGVDEADVAKFRMQIHSTRPQVLRDIRRFGLAYNSKLYESLSNDELASYLQFAETPSGQWYVKALRQSVVSAMTDASRSFGRDLGALAKQDAAVPAKAAGH